MSVLPVHLHLALGWGTTVVGLIIGLQSVATLSTRHCAGSLSDTQGAKKAVVIGLIACSLSGCFYLLSMPIHLRILALSIIAAGRVLLGIGESMLITGALSWGIAIIGPENVGFTMSWNGIAMYASLAVGAPISIALNQSMGFAAVAVAVCLCPIAALLLISRLRPAAPLGGVRMPIRRLVKAICLPGLGLALSSVGYVSIAAFGTLYFASMGWRGASGMLLAFGGFYVLARLLFSRFPDRIGGLRVAMGSLVVELIGQLIIWRAHAPSAAIVGAALTGFGCSMIFPGFGTDAARRAPAQNRGAAMGAFAAFFDITIGLVCPVMGGMINGMGGYPGLFALGAVCTIISFLIALHSSREQACRQIEESRYQAGGQV